MVQHVRSRFMIATIHCLAAFAAVSAVDATAAAETSPSGMREFLRGYCAECHAGGAAEGGFSMEPLLGQSKQGQSNQSGGFEGVRAYERIFQQLSRKKMPPKEAKQPMPDERRSAITALQGILDEVIDDRGSRYAGAFARRLNREELQNDLFDTLGVDRTLYGLPPFAGLLPEEGRTEGFDTVGAGLVPSALLLDQYQQFVEYYLALAADDYPPPQRWRFKFGSRYLAAGQTEFEGLGPRTFAFQHNHKEGEPDRSVPAFDLTWRLQGRSHSPHQTPAEVDAALHSFFPNTADERERARLDLAREGGLPFNQQDSLLISRRIGVQMRPRPLSVGSTGVYKVRLRCRLRFTEGVEPAPVYARYFNRSHHFIGRIEQRDLTDEATNRFDEDRPRPCFENRERFVAMTPGEWVMLEFDDFRSTSEVYDATRSGLTFDFRFESAARPKTRGAPREQPARNGRPAILPALEEIEAHYPFLVEVDYLEVEGPYPLVAEPDRLIPSRPAPGSNARGTAENCLAALLPRLYRGPLDRNDLDLHLEIFDRNFARTRDFSVSLRATLCAAYLSPKHLFVSNTAAKRQPGELLPDHELAARLSLFLWSSTPDAELRAAADRGELRDPAVLERHAKRMLDHPYASELSANFAFQWLRLYDIGLNEPDPDLYSYDKHLEKSMVNESLRFFHEILHANHSIRLFLDSDWMLVNDRLAGLYQYKLSGQEPRRPFSSWRKIPVSALPRHAGVRGGLLGQASILKLTSGSIRTSIVSRGMFILDNLLDDPPSPPPENVGEIANAVADLDQKSVREQLEIHRRRATCAACHHRIDPLGFALENYGAIGQWRTKETDGMKPIVEVEETVVPFKGGTRLERKTKKIERQGHPVDTKAVIMGTPVDGPRELRDWLLAKEDMFARCLISKLMVYGLGRGLRHQDEVVIDQIVAASAKGDYRLREIIELIVVSDSFRTY